MSYNANAAEAYLTNSVENAPPIKIVRMLYQGALRFIAQASKEDAGSPASKFVEHLSNADAIVAELRLALDPEASGGEVVDNLTQLYLFCEGEIQRAMIGRTNEPLASVQRVLETLLEAWQHVEVESAQAR
ncbi:MAG: flagellar export chaperone FliS [Planctomycetota bacterium]